MRLIKAFKAVFYSPVLIVLYVLYLTSRKRNKIDMDLLRLTNVKFPWGGKNVVV